MDTFKGFLVEVTATGRTQLLAGKEPVATEASFGNRTPLESVGIHKHTKYCTLQSTWRSLQHPCEFIRPLKRPLKSKFSLKNKFSSIRT